MAKRLFIGGLPWSVTDQQLEEIFAAHGKVSSAKVITDKFTGKSKGFGFVEYEKDEEADIAIKALDGSSLEERKINVNVARPMEDRSSNGPSRFNDRRRSDNRRGYRQKS